MKVTFRNIKAEEIDLRIGTTTNKGFTILLYKNARVDMAMLDEQDIIWQRDHKEVKGNLYCGIGIYDTDIQQWVWKWDCGVESFSEKEKGEASDSFKRAGFNWGIGRELYTAPFIWINYSKNDLTEDEKKAEQKAISSWRVSQIEIDAGKIIKLELVDKKGNQTFAFGTPKIKNDRGENESADKPTRTFKHTGESLIGMDCDDGSAIAEIFNNLKTFYPETMKELREQKIEITKLPKAFNVRACDLSIEDIQEAIKVKKDANKE